MLIQSPWGKQFSDVHEHCYSVFNVDIAQVQTKRVRRIHDLVKHLWSNFTKITVFSIAVN